MKKSTIIQILTIIVLVIILGVLVKFTIEAINEKSMPQISNQGMNGQSGNMPGQMGGNSSTIEYSGATEITEDTTNIVLKLDNSSKIKLTGDSYITSLETDDPTYSNIDFNGYKLYVNGVAIN